MSENNEPEKTAEESTKGGWFGFGWVRRIFSRNNNVPNPDVQVPGPGPQQNQNSGPAESTSQRKRQGDGSGDGPLPKISRPHESQTSDKKLASRRSLISEQDAAFQESLRKDQEKEFKKHVAEQTKKKKEQEQKELERKRAEALNSLSPEPPSNEPGVFPIAIRLPSGLRLRRYFRPSDSVQDLYNFVFSHPNFENLETFVLTTGVLKTFRINSETEGTFASNNIQSSITFYVDL